ncbi:MAG: HmuY family protein [Calditrichaeota bacterium]|nr:HmuY family protein [Candidatus Cloacimonadota bacterium]MCA9786959.1 HmuY family protein [Candidatus Cloacimonadota bacterium]MCB1046332.1 HmuY family protein [Calditrichota bacterium]MCB9473859.1 HmuY family protein [Candidatus Delongbacteria bacterium]
MNTTPWRRTALFLPLAASLFLGLQACSDDDSSNDTFNEPTDQATWDDGQGGWYSRVDASDAETWARFDLADRAFNGSAWTIKFRRSEIALNGGDSGDGSVSAINLADHGLIPAGGFDALAAVDASLTESDWMTDLNSNPLAGWYNYNPMTHEITPSDSVYVLRCADGNHYAKFQVNVIDNPGMSNPGTLTLNYVHQATAGNLDLSATPQSFQVDCSSGAAYISFASAGQVTVADPLTSMDWDLFVDGYDIHFNAGEYGPGTAGGYSAQLADLNHADVSQAAPTPNLYMAESVQSVFSSWYDYDGATHQLSPADCLYLVRDGSSTWKLEILSYYNPATDASGWFKIRYALLP